MGRKKLGIPSVFPSLKELLANISFDAKTVRPYCIEWGGQKYYTSGSSRSNAFRNFLTTLSKGIQEVSISEIIQETKNQE